MRSLPFKMVVLQRRSRVLELLWVVVSTSGLQRRYIVHLLTIILCSSLNTKMQISRRTTIWERSSSGSQLSHLQRMAGMDFIVYYITGVVVNATETLIMAFRFLNSPPLC